MTKPSSSMSEELKEEIAKIAQEIYYAGEDGAPEESAVPSGVDKIYSLFASQREKVVEEIRKQIEWEVGTVMAGNVQKGIDDPKIKTNSEDLLLNREHVYKVLDSLSPNRRSKK